MGRKWGGAAVGSWVSILSRPTVKNYKFEKSKMAGAAILKNRKIATSRPRVDRFRPNLARRRSSTLLKRPTVKTVKPRRRYNDFSKDGGRRHLGFFKFEIFNGPTALDGRTASPCQARFKSVKPRPRYGDFSIFPRWRLSVVTKLLPSCR